MSMELVAKAPQTLSTRKNSDEILSKAKADCTGAPRRLPLELLIEIIGQLPNLRSACSFARVNKSLHYYSIRRIYANFYVETRGFLHLLVRNIHQDIQWINENSSVSEMLRIFDAKGVNNLYGLFSRPEHLMAVRRLRVGNTGFRDKSSIMGTVVRKILSEIFNGAKALQTADIYDSGSPNAALPFCLKNISYAQTFTSLSIASLSFETWKVISQDVPSLKEISCDDFDRDFLDKVTGSEYANHRIEALTYPWCPQTNEGSLDVKGDIYSCLPIIMPKLRRLSIHHILKAPSSSDNGGVTVFYFTVTSTFYNAISKQIRENYVSLVQNLRNLQDFTMTLEVVGEIEITPMVDQGAYTELGQKAAVEEEVQLVKHLSIGNPTLTRVTVGNSWGNWAGAIRTFNFSTLWKKIGTSLSEKGADTGIWTPQPHLKPYWWLWFAEYRTPQHVREIMIKHWEQSDIPSLIELEGWYSQNPIAN